MVTQEMARFAALRIGSDDLARATRGYALLLGCTPQHVAADVVRFTLARGAVELAAGAPGAQGLRLAATAAGSAAALTAARAARFGGIAVLVDPASTPAVPEPAATPLAAATPTTGGFLGVDHVVVNTTDPTRAIGLWRDTLGLRLALDREFPARGLRMLFFRSAGVTLEVVSPIGGGAAGDDVLHGVAYRVADVARVRDRLLAAGLDVSAVREGNKRGTRVATVRSGTEGVPTLLIEALPGDAERA